MLPDKMTSLRKLIYKLGKIIVKIRIKNKFFEENVKRLTIKNNWMTEKKKKRMRLINTLP